MPGQIAALVPHSARGGMNEAGDLSPFFSMASGVVGLGAAPASAAELSVAITGSVQCEHGEPVTGVWVNSSLGGSGWGKTLKETRRNGQLFPIPVGGGTVSLAYGTDVSIHAGCGTTGNVWASDNWTGNVVVHHPGHLILNAYSCTPPKWVKDQTVRGSCALPPQGHVGSTTNQWGTPVSGGKGYCTCGAAYMWFRNTGWYPAWKGDASAWISGARANGWHISSYPVEHALIVWPGADHVGFVTSINDVD